MYCYIGVKVITERPDGKDMMKCPDVDSLDALFGDCSNLILVPFPSILPVDSVTRFEIGEDNSFMFQVTEEFLELRKFLVRKLSGRRPTIGRVRILGATGCGKSHLIAAMTSYLARRYELRTEGDKSHCTIYIPSCKKFLQLTNPLAAFKAVLLEAFHDGIGDDADIESIMSWDDVYNFLARKDRVSIVLDECNLLYTMESTSNKDGLLGLYDAAVNVIEVISGRSKFNSPGFSTEDWDLFPLNSGFHEQGAAWQSWINAYFPNATNEEVGLLWGATEGVPLYLNALRLIPRPTLRGKIEAMLRFPVLDTKSLSPFIGIQLAKDYATNKLNLRHNEFVLALCRVSIGAPAVYTKFEYDSRFFYVDDHDRFHAVNGIVRRATARVLWMHADMLTSEAFDAWNSVSWDEIKYSDSTNLALKGFAFETYALTRIAANVGLVVENESCGALHVVYFDGDYPSTSELHRSEASGATLFWPAGKSTYQQQQVQHQYVCGVVRLVRSAKDIVILGIRVLINAASQHRDAMDFFRKYRRTGHATVDYVDTGDGDGVDDQPSKLARLEDTDDFTPAKVALTREEVGASNYLRYSSCREVADSELVVPQCGMVWVHPTQCRGLDGYGPVQLSSEELDLLAEGLKEYVVYL